MTHVTWLSYGYTYVHVNTFLHTSISDKTHGVTVYTWHDSCVYTSECVHVPLYICMTHGYTETGGGVTVLPAGRTKVERCSFPSCCHRQYCYPWYVWLGKGEWGVEKESGGLRDRSRASGICDWAQASERPKTKRRSMPVCANYKCECRRMQRCAGGMQRKDWLFNRLEMMVMTHSNASTRSCANISILTFLIFSVSFSPHPHECVCMCVYVCIHTRTHMHAQTRTHTHTHTSYTFKHMYM